MDMAIVTRESEWLLTVLHKNGCLLLTHPRVIV